MIVKLLTEHNLEFLSLKEGRRSSSESTHVKMPYSWKSNALPQIIFQFVCSPVDQSPISAGTVLTVHQYLANLYQ